MGLLDGLRNRLVGFLQGVINDAYSQRVEEILGRREYRLGIQKRFIKVRAGQANDNMVANFTGLAVERGVSMLFGKPPEFEFERGEADQTGEETVSAQETYIDEVWEANNKPVLLHKVAVNGGEAGMCFAKIVPDAVMHNGTAYPRLVALDPAFMDIKTDPDDMEKVIKYIIQYKIVDDTGHEIAKREVTEWQPTSDTEPNTGTWLITNEQFVRYKWEIVGQPIQWEWDFPPIVHWQNLPCGFDTWGMPDVTADVVELQDRYNFVISNMSKIIRLYAHPQRWSKMFGNASKVTMGPDDMPNINDPAGEINQLQPVADLAASHQFSLSLRQSLFDITRTVDISSMADKIGALTNFGLHVLYQDALGKLETKRALYGWGLREINRRLLVLANMEPLDCDVVWKDPLPEDAQGNATVDQMQLEMGIVDKQTISERAGYNWKKVSERQKDEQQANQDIGTYLLGQFDRGGFGQPNQPNNLQNRGNNNGR